MDGRWSSLLILVAALIVALIGALIAGSPEPDDIRTMVVPSQAVTGPGAEAAIAPAAPGRGRGSWTTAGPMTADAYLQAATLLATARCSSRVAATTP